MKFLLAAINAKYIHSNLGVYSLKQYAAPRARKVQVEIGEYTINHQMEHILEDIYKRKPDAVGFSCYIWNIFYVMELVKDMKKVLPRTHIWLGGPEVSYCARRILEDHREVTGVMIGEGEETFARLLEEYQKIEGAEGRPASEEEISKKASSFSGTAVRLTKEGGKEQAAENGPAPFLDMDDIPFAYGDLAGFENRIIYYERSRGCPFSWR